ncbi:hypothetical protein IQ22_04652 [Pseudomonas duriflava]|uniref:Uncharacterized protein n=1 Tax=Pseudomonas duriflava TaxID=459528 RepID=A0A562PLL1_9PSED|nr:hypothetical protein [Pseudomonas duriflava]TWI45203.1 hypothetical protein IQ22_04652 [Pseudomonas duriflava]
MRNLYSHQDGFGDLDIWMVDPTIIPATRAAAGGEKKARTNRQVIA